MPLTTLKSVEKAITILDCFFLEKQVLIRIAKVDLIGKSLSLYTGAAGKILLAFLPEEKRREIYSLIRLERLTPNAIIKPEVGR